MADRKFSTALLLDGKGGARQLEDDEIDRWRPDDGLLWVDLNLSNTAARKWLRANPFIDSGAADILLAGETRPRSLVHGEGMIVVMRGINMNAGAAVDFWRIFTSQKCNTHRRSLHRGDLVARLVVLTPLERCRPCR